MSFSFGVRHLAVPNAARCGAASLRSKLVSLPGLGPGNAAFPPHTPLSFRPSWFASCEFAKGKLVWLAGRSPGNAAFPHTRPLPSLGGGSCAPLQELTFAALDELSSTSGTIVRTIRKPRPLWAHLLWAGLILPPHRKVPHSQPPPLWRGFLHPTSGTIIRHMQIGHTLPRRSALHLRN